MSEFFSELLSELLSKCSKNEQNAGFHTAVVDNPYLDWFLAPIDNATLHKLYQVYNPEDHAVAYLLSHLLLGRGVLFGRL